MRLNLKSNRLQLKLYEEHFGVKFSEAKENLYCKVYRVQFQPNVNEETAKYTKLSLRGEVYLVMSELTLGKSR